MNRKAIISLAAYLVIAAVTYGFAFHDELRFENEKFPGSTRNRDYAQVTGAMCAFAWPIYWPFHVSRILWTP